MSWVEIGSSVLQPVRAMRSYLELTPAAKSEYWKDRLELSNEDPGLGEAIKEAVAWLCRAQDHSASHDGGVARHFSLLSGWGNSYPETTGYIVPTLLNYAKLHRDQRIFRRANRMLNWLVSIQFPDGSFQGGPIGAQPLVAVSFNTGQILLGLAAGVREFGCTYFDAMCRAADWLVSIQDSDGCWRRYPTPFAKPGEKAYDTHIAWGLFEAARIEPKKAYTDAGITNVKWALSLQQENGWFEKCCLEDSSCPLTHTLGYALRGIIEAYQFTRDSSFLAAALKTANGLLMAMASDGFLPGRLDREWRGTVPWACLTGTVQSAICWLMLYQFTGNTRYRDAGYAANQYVRRTMKLEVQLDTRGGIKGSFPVNGDYGTYEYLNWACKFFIDANLLEKEIRESQGYDVRVLQRA